MPNFPMNANTTPNVTKARKSKKYFAHQTSSIESAKLGYLALPCDLYTFASKNIYARLICTSGFRIPSTFPFIVYASLEKE